MYLTSGWKREEEVVVAEEYFTSGRMRKEDVVMAEEYFTSGWRREEEVVWLKVKTAGSRDWRTEREREREEEREIDLEANYSSDGRPFRNEKAGSSPTLPGKFSVQGFWQLVSACTDIHPGLYRNISSTVHTYILIYSIQRYILSCIDIYSRLYRDIFSSVSLCSMSSSVQSYDLVCTVI